MSKTQKKNTAKIRSDRVTLQGTEELTTISTGATGNGCINAGSSAINLSVVSLGSRPQVCGTIFKRFRFVSLKLKYIPSVGSTTAGSICIGISDDAIESDDTVIVTYAATVPLRRTLETQVWTKGSLQWSPVDLTKWYYVTSDAVDTRFNVQCSLYGNGLGLAASTVYGTLILSYIVEFEGAVTPETPI